MCLCMYVYMSICMCLCMCVCMCLCIDVCGYACLRVHKSTISNRYIILYEGSFDARDIFCLRGLVEYRQRLRPSHVRDTQRRTNGQRHREKETQRHRKMRREIARGRGIDEVDPAPPIRLRFRRNQPPPTSARCQTPG